MKYLELYEDFKNLFPEDASEFKKYEEETGADDPKLVHLCFGSVVCPYVYDLLRSKNKEKLKKAFAFFEKMANDSDYDVQGVLQCSVIENLTDDDILFKESIPYMGPMTKKFVNQVASYMDIEPIYEAYH